MMRLSRSALNRARMLTISSSSPSATTALRSFSSLSTPDGNKAGGAVRKSLVTGEEGVHQTMKTDKSWRQKPLFRRQGDVRFKTGLEAARLLIQEAARRDAHEINFIHSVTANLECLAPIFDRNPKYAFVAKTLLEPERFVQFRVSWIDDTGVVRMNRGYRIQYGSSLGPYYGPLHFGSHINNSVMKAMAFDTIFSNALTGYPLGAAAGGADINTLDKSEAEMQRFCQSYMTECAKYIGPEQDYPTMGMGCGRTEMGYLFGQYKRITPQAFAAGGKFFLSPAFHEAPGFGVVHFAKEMLQDKGDSLVGKRCLILGSGKVARCVAEKLIELGAIPLSFSDASGHVYEPEGMNQGKLRTINRIKDERGALLGRYIISSTTAEFNNPANVFDIPCDLCFPCGAMYEIDEAAANALANNGCQGVIEGGDSTVTAPARKTLKKRGVMYGPHAMTMTGSAIVHSIGPGCTDELLAEEVSRIYQDVKQTASEFNARGDLFAGANIAGFLRVANVMMTHGAV